jgi:glycerol-3-phosphate dehydrogenase
MTSKILVIGSGAWGTALALLLAKQNSRVNLLTKNHPVFVNKSLKFISKKRTLNL